MLGETAGSLGDFLSLPGPSALAELLSFFKQSARALHLFANSLTLLAQRVSACVHSLCNNDRFQFLTLR